MRTPPFLYKLFKNIADCYRGRNLIWQGIFIGLTAIFVATGFDWYYYLATRSAVLQSLLFPAVILGSLVPVVLPIAMLFWSVFFKNIKTRIAAYAAIQAGLLGLGISSFYKVFTGRMGPPHSLFIDISHMFRFGFLRGGAFQGWPSSHTSVAFAMSLTLVALYPENKWIKYGACIYALYIGIGVSTNIHWFSDFVAGAILGSIIGLTVGKRFLEKYLSSLNPFGSSTS